MNGVMNGLDRYLYQTKDQRHKSRRTNPPKFPTRVAAADVALLPLLPARKRRVKKMWVNNAPTLKLWNQQKLQKTTETPNLHSLNLKKIV